MLNKISSYSPTNVYAQKVNEINKKQENDKQIAGTLVGIATATGTVAFGGKIKEVLADCFEGLKDLFLNNSSKVSNVEPIKPAEEIISSVLNNTQNKVDDIIKSMIV